MEPQTASILATMTYKIFCLAAGSFSIYLGYRLFEKGIFGEAGNMEGGNGSITIKVTNAAPGTVFATVGLGVIIFTVQQGMTFTGTDNGKGTFEDSAGNPIIGNVSPQIIKPNAVSPSTTLQQGSSFTSAGKVVSPSHQLTLPNQPQQPLKNLSGAEIRQRLNDSMPHAQVKP